MLGPVRSVDPQWSQASSAPSTANTPADPAPIRRALDEAAVTDRPQTALALTAGMDDAQLFALAASESGTRALAALDTALADAAPTLDGVQPQRLRLADALDRSEHPVDADPVGMQTPASQVRALFERVIPDPVIDAPARTTRTTEHIGDNTVTWTVDRQGRPVRAEAELSEVFTDLDRSSEETQAQREAADRGIEGDHGGHIIGHRFVTDQGLKNLFPQNGNFNVSAYKTLENEWADWIDSGKDVHITVDLAPRGQDRPERVRVSYEVIDPATGDVVYDQRVTFRNEAGQRYERVPQADMALY